MNLESEVAIKQFIQEMNEVENKISKLLTELSDKHSLKDISINIKKIDVTDSSSSTKEYIYNVGLNVTII